MVNRFSGYLNRSATAWRAPALRPSFLATFAFTLLAMVAFSPRVEAIPMLSVGSATVAVGDTFTIPVSITDAADLSSFQFDLSFDALILQAIGVTESAFFTQGDITVFIPGFIDNTGGQILGVSDALLFQPSVNGSGILANIEFTAISAGTSALTLSNAFLNLSDSGFDMTNGEVCVTAPGSTTCAPGGGGGGGGGPGGGGGQVPEPGTVALLAIGFAALTWRQRWTGTRSPGPVLHAA